MRVAASWMNFLAITSHLQQIVQYTFCGCVTEWFTARTAWMRLKQTACKSSAKAVIACVLNIRTCTSNIFKSNMYLFYFNFKAAVLRCFFRIRALWRGLRPVHSRCGPMQSGGRLRERMGRRHRYVLESTTAITLRQ